MPDWVLPVVAIVLSAFGMGWSARTLFDIYAAERRNKN